MSDLTITTFEDLQQYGQGEVVELPPFEDGKPFVARLKKASMTSLMSAGKLPNSLMEIAINMFESSQADAKKKKKDTFDPGDYKQLLDLYEVVCSAAFVEPTWEQIKQSGVFLTNAQYNFVMEYTQGSVNALKTFRE